MEKKLEPMVVVQAVKQQLLLRFKDDVIMNMLMTAQPQQPHRQPSTRPVFWSSFTTELSFEAAFILET